MNYSQKCGVACQFIPFVNREDFRQEFIQKKSESELSSECKKFLNICCDKEKEFYILLNHKKIPSELKKFIKD